MKKSLGQIAYEAYRETVGNVDYRGEPLPDWEKLFSDKVRYGWEKAAKAVEKAIMNDVVRIIDAM